MTRITLCCCVVFFLGYWVVSAGAAAATPASSAQDKSNPQENLEKKLQALEQAYQAGILSQEEYAQKKEQLVAQIKANQANLDRATQEKLKALEAAYQAGRSHCNVLPPNDRPRQPSQSGRSAYCECQHERNPSVERQTPVEQHSHQGAWPSGRCQPAGSAPRRCPP